MERGEGTRVSRAWELTRTSLAAPLTRQEDERLDLTTEGAAPGDGWSLPSEAPRLRLDYRKAGRQLLTYGGYCSEKPLRVPADGLTAEYLQRSGFQEPVLAGPPSTGGGRAEELQALGMQLPEGRLSVRDIAVGVGRSAPVRTIDVVSQGDGPRLSMGEWEAYWMARTAPKKEAAVAPAAPAGSPSSGPGTLELEPADGVRIERSAEGGEKVVGVNGLRINLGGAPAPPPQPPKSRPRALPGGRASKLVGRLFNVVSLSLAGTPLELGVVPPRAVRDLDLAADVWSPRPGPGAWEDAAPPKVQLYALMSPAGSFTDWHVDFGGSSVWYHLVEGEKVFALCPPTERNLKAFKAWASSPRQGRTLFTAHTEGCRKVVVRAGETVLIPGGWPHAVFTPQHSIAVGGNFLHSVGLRQQLEVWGLEDALGVKPDFRYPAFKRLMWYAAETYRERLRLEAEAGALCGQRPSPRPQASGGPSFAASRMHMLRQASLGGTVDHSDSGSGGSPSNAQALYPRETDQPKGGQVKFTGPRLKIRMPGMSAEPDPGLAAAVAPAAAPVSADPNRLVVKLRMAEPEVSIGSDVAWAALSGQPSQGYPAVSMSPRVPCISGLEIQGVPALVEKLREWLYDGGIYEVPSSIEDPDSLLAELTRLCQQLGVDVSEAHFLDYAGAVLPPRNEGAGRRANGQFAPGHKGRSGANVVDSPKKKVKLPQKRKPAPPRFVADALLEGSRKRPTPADGAPASAVGRPPGPKKLKSSSVASVRARLGKKLGLKR